jgi:hypothetical protein
MIEATQSTLASQSTDGPERRHSLATRGLRLIGDHPVAFWLPTLVVLACGVALTVGGSLSRSPDRIGLLLGVALVVSLIAGFVVARIVDGPDATFQSTEEVEHDCQIPVLGVVPVNDDCTRRRS